MCYAAARVRVSEVRACGAEGTAVEPGLAGSHSRPGALVANETSTLVMRCISPRERGNDALLSSPTAPHGAPLALGRAGAEVEWAGQAVPPS
jgi:hypothetical protein